jgi:hypothetical protein
MITPLHFFLSSAVFLDAGYISRQGISLPASRLGILISIASGKNFGAGRGVSPLKRISLYFAAPTCNHTRFSNYSSVIEKEEMAGIPPTTLDRF